MGRELEQEKLIFLYRLMVKIRLHEEAIKILFTQGKIGGTTHLCIGQEAVAAGVVSQLRPDDYVSSTHRGHGHMLAKGGELKPMLAEILGRADGYCKGKGGSMHIASIKLGNLGANGIVSGGLPIAVGSALSAQMRETDQVTVVSFGDGAANEGNTHESMNMASAWRLPVVFLFENNQYAVSTHTTRSMGGSMEKRAAGYDLPFVQVDGMDLEQVYFAAQDAIAHARAGKGPIVMQADTYRYEGHYYGDPMIYRTKEEIDSYRANDPIARVERILVERNIESEDHIEKIKADIQAEVDDAVSFAEASPQPAINSMFEDVYTEWQS
jgi:pyruvate dehydrogenase E1 component alpha subunit